MKTLIKFATTVLIIFTISCKEPDKNEMSDNETLAGKTEEKANSETFVSSGPITNNLTDKIHSDKAVITLFTISDAKPNALFSFSFDANLKPDKLGDAPNTPGYWYEAIININGKDITRFNPPSANTLPLTLNFEVHNLKADSNGQIVIKLINVHTQVWPSIIVGSVFQKGSLATLSYIKN